MWLSLQGHYENMSPKVLFVHSGACACNPDVYNKSIRSPPHPNDIALGNSLWTYPSIIVHTNDGQCHKYNFVEKDLIIELKAKP